MPEGIAPTDDAGSAMICSELAVVAAILKRALRPPPRPGAPAGSPRAGA
jgi:hypothetical protein